MILIKNKFKVKFNSALKKGSLQGKGVLQIEFELDHIIQIIFNIIIYTWPPNVSSTIQMLTQMKLPSIYTLHVA